jgi:site-specific DNA-cytosine methylase
LESDAGPYRRGSRPAHHRSGKCTLTSHGGKDFAAICSAFEKADYSFGALVIDAAHFVPQSRPRLFIVGIRNDIEIPADLFEPEPSAVWHSRSLRTAYENVRASQRRNWVWWSLPTPPTRNTCFADLIEDDPADVQWRTASETQRLLAMMSEVNRAKVDEAKKAKRRLIGAIYKRTRHDESGRKVQRADASTNVNRCAGHLGVHTCCFRPEHASSTTTSIKSSVAATPPSGDHRPPTLPPFCDGLLLGPRFACGFLVICDRTAGPEASSLTKLHSPRSVALCATPDE